MEHPAVKEAAAVASPDERRGDIVKAFIVLASGHEPSDELAERDQAARPRAPLGLRLPARDRVRRRPAEDPDRQDPPRGAARAGARAEAGRGARPSRASGRARLQLARATASAARLLAGRAARRLRARVPRATARRWRSEAPRPRRSGALGRRGDRPRRRGPRSTEAVTLAQARPAWSASASRGERAGRSRRARTSSSKQRDQHASRTRPDVGEARAGEAVREQLVPALRTPCEQVAELRRRVAQAVRRGSRDRAAAPRIVDWRCPRRRPRARREHVGCSRRRQLDRVVSSGADAGGSSPASTISASSPARAIPLASPVVALELRGVRADSPRGSPRAGVRRRRAASAIRTSASGS